MNKRFYLEALRDTLGSTMIVHPRRRLELKTNMVPIWKIEMTRKLKI